MYLFFLLDLDPCLFYTVLSDPWRNIGFTPYPVINPLSDNNLTSTWYRFMGVGGDVMPEKCYQVYDGAPNCVVYLDFPHPNIFQGIVSGTSYCYWNGNCYYYTIPNMQVLACIGYYVYNLPPVPVGVSFGVLQSPCYVWSCGPDAECGYYGACTCDVGLKFPTVFPVNTDNYGCEDIDECAETVGLCGANAGCANTFGSYNCYCLPGFLSSSGLIWEMGITQCTGLENYLNSMTSTSLSPEALLLINIQQKLNSNPNAIIPLGVSTKILDQVNDGRTLKPNEDAINSTTASSMMDTVMMIINSMNASAQNDNIKIGNILLSIFERLASGFVEHTLNCYTKNVTTPAYEMWIEAIGPELYLNMTTVSLLSVKGGTMAVNLSALAQENNGSAAAVLLSVNGMEKFLSTQGLNNSSTLNSQIITAVLPGINSSSLPDPVSFTFLNNKTSDQNGQHICVYWKQDNWSTDGCEFSVSSEDHTICKCSHLSTFAMLLQVEQGKQQDDPMLDWVNKVCVCIGLFFLALAVLTFLFCSWNPKVNNTARLHLCICLFVAQLLFLVGVSQTKNKLVCSVIAGVLQFFFLSSFVWMFLETLQLFLLVRGLTKVKVIEREGLKVPYLLLIGYGIPLVVVGVSAGLVPSGYGSSQQCWLNKDNGFIWSFVGPVCAILGINCVLFFLILWSLHATLISMRSGMSQASETRMILFKILAQFVILGCAWILGFYQNSLLLQYLFTILNSQQGTFIFIVHCLFNKEVRQEYISWISRFCKVEVQFQNQQPSVCEDSFDDSMRVAHSDSNSVQKEDTTTQTASTATKNDMN